jgi:type III pantothenate kinase
MGVSRDITVMAVEIGNTNTHVGSVDIIALTCSHRKDFASATLRDDPALILEYIGEDDRNVPWVIAGGRNGLANDLERVVKKQGIERITQLCFHDNLPLAFRYDNPRSLGADRIANALFAHRRYPKRTVIAISSGTAVTIDLIASSAEFLGGAIMAGIPAQLCGLRVAAPALPLLPVPEPYVPLPATSTEACMFAGTVHGTAGAINHIVARYCSSISEEPIIIATGGGWEITESHIDFRYTFEPDMTIIGTGLYSRYS